jgi:hypothetical protein
VRDIVFRHGSCGPAGRLARLVNMRKYLAGLIVLGLLSVCAGIVGDVRGKRRQAESLLEDLRRLDGNADPTSSFRSFKEKHRHQLTIDECRGNTCQYEFLVDNWVLSTLRLAPHTEMRAAVALFQGKLATVGVEYTSRTLEQHSPIVRVQEDFCADRADIRCDHFALNPHGRNVAPSWNGIIEFGQLARVEQKEAAWALNLDCFSSHKSCKDISQLLPTLWKATGPGVVSSRVRSTADAISEASQPLSD